jgi:hypothetical protein
MSSLGNANGGWQQQQKTQNQMQFDTSMTPRRRCWCWPLVRAADPRWGNGWGAQQKSAAGGPMSSLKMQLVETVKRSQRENPDRREAWHAFCDAELGGNRDPARQEPDVLQAFLDQQGVRNPDRKEAWHAFCDAELGGNRDPARPEPDVLQAFLLDQQAVSVDISSLGNADGTLEACARFKAILQKSMRVHRSFF